MWNHITRWVFQVYDFLRNSFLDTHVSFVHGLLWPQVPSSLPCRFAKAMHSPLRCFLKLSDLTRSKNGSPSVTPKWIVKKMTWWNLGHIQNSIFWNERNGDGSPILFPYWGNRHPTAAIASGTVWVPWCRTGLTALRVRETLRRAGKEGKRCPKISKHGICVGKFAHLDHVARIHGKI